MENTKDWIIVKYGFEERMVVDDQLTAEDVFNELTNNFNYPKSIVVDAVDGSDCYCETFGDGY